VKTTVNTAKNKLFVLLQSGLPLVARPFAELGRAVGLTEEQALPFVRGFLSAGVARRVSAVFDARRLGYRSVLCAAGERDGERLTELAERVVAHPGVTHCYERSWPTQLDPHSVGGPGVAVLPNLWFVLVAPQGEFEVAAQELRDRAASHAVLFFPARKRFKIDVVFEPEQLVRGENFPEADEPGLKLSETQQELVRLLQGGLPVAADCFAQVAQQVELTEKELLAQLRQWRAEGVLRRLALALRRGGGDFRANAMCVWPVAPERITAAGRALAAFPEVEHCYERIAHPAFCYNLYAMIHSPSWRETQRLFERLKVSTGLEEGQMLCSVQKFKQSGMNYFAPAKQAVLV
jgi:DNA-binding Lrp family transcriptional regulator